jgi:thiol-disulfide isomerase/thioredoxin
MLTTALVSLALAAGPAIIEDDFPTALQKARQEKKVLFVDAWAPWCHSCVFMREHVLSKDDFAPFSKQVVFAAVDTEKAKSAAFLAKYPVEVWPTLFFIDPVSEAVVLRWAGTVDAAQMKALIAAASGAGTKTREADLLAAKGNASEAAKKYSASLQGGTVEATTLLRLLGTQYEAKDFDGCARTADEHVAQLTSVVDQAPALGWGLGCALELETPSAAQATVRASLVTRARAMLGKEGPLADDLSGLYELLVQERSQAKDAPVAKKLAAEWLTFLEGQAAKAKTPAARAVFDPHRVNAALAAGTPERALPAVVQSEKDFPADYNPPARQALLLQAMKKNDEALAAIDRALSKCTEGPRKLRLFSLKAGLQQEKGDSAGRKKTLEAAVAWAQALPPSQLPKGRLEALQKDLAATR